MNVNSSHFEEINFLEIFPNNDHYCRYIGFNYIFRFRMDIPNTLALKPFSINANIEIDTLKDGNFLMKLKYCKNISLKLQMFSIKY